MDVPEQYRHPLNCPSCGNFKEYLLHMTPDGYYHKCVNCEYSNCLLCLQCGMEHCEKIHKLAKCSENHYNGLCLGDNKLEKREDVGFFWRIMSLFGF